MGEDGAMECARGERGEIWVRAPNITKGYWRNESATRNTITQEGWLKTGDVGFVDEQGKWFVVERMKVWYSISFPLSKTDLHVVGEPKNTCETCAHRHMSDP